MGWFGLSASMRYSISFFGICGVNEMESIVGEIEVG